MKSAQTTNSAWTIDDSAQLYGLNDWGRGYFSLNTAGEVCVNLHDKTDANTETADFSEKREVSIKSLIDGLRERGTQLPILLRFGDLLGERISEINTKFNDAITELGYDGSYRGVYPIKVNQQREVIEQIADFGKKYRFGFEAGSKPELIAALAYLPISPAGDGAHLICNGYKDAEFIDLALIAQKMGYRITLVLEMPGELALVAERAEKLGIRPHLGLRIRLSVRGSGHWSNSTGDSSVFGLNAAQSIDIIDELKSLKMLDCLHLLHYHQGSQIPNIGSIRQAAVEAARIYVDLLREGAKMTTLDIGGGMAVDYDGSKSDSTSSCNYGIREYALDIIESIMTVCNEAKVPHPDIISESGRAVVAYSSALFFNILDVSSIGDLKKVPALPENKSQMLINLAEILNYLDENRLRECYNDAVYYRDQIRMMHFHGSISLRERGIGERLYWQILQKISQMLQNNEDPSIFGEELAALKNSLVDFYYGNFSLFQSLPDAWAIDQIFPVMPIHRLDEKPTQHAVLADITCDCDGKIDRFIEGQLPNQHRSGEIARTLPLHQIKSGDDYCIGVFLVGAYQETLGDLHNLLGDTNIAGITLQNGELKITNEVEGDTVADVLSYVEYDPKEMLSRFRKQAEFAVESKNISPAERRSVLDSFRSGLHGYTYFES